MALTVNGLSGIGGDENARWEDITSQLIWQTGKAVKLLLVGINEYVYSWETPDTSGTTSDKYYDKCRHAVIGNAAPGEKYRVTGWCQNDITHGLYAFLDAGGNLIDVGFSGRSLPSQGTTACGIYTFDTLEFVVPLKAETVLILNWNKQMSDSYSLDDIIVEKAVQ